jgi:hypothetical protein
VSVIDRGRLLTGVFIGHALGRPRRATGILTPRCAQASNRFEHICTHPHNQTATA